jgi:L-ascorbate metabolism protein UlaG (beta-lactamase superfamily)
VVVAGAATALANCHGHVIERVHAPNYGKDFDFRSPPCSPAPAAPAGGEDVVLVRYLASGGLYVSWRGTGILTAPFFSNPGLFRVVVGRVGWRESEIARGLSGLPAAGAVFAGHAHYDHVGDLVPILRTHAPGARLYVSATGDHMLAPYRDLRSRASVLKAAKEWERVRDAAGRPLPFRFRAFRSRHAPHLGRLHLFQGRLERDWQRPWTDMRWRDFREGEVYTFVFDLLDGDGRVRFRLYANDTASPREWGVPEAALAHERRFDLAALTMASYYLADGYPERLLGALRPRHVLAIHYEDFFRSLDAPLRFVPLLTNGRANRFLERVEESVPLRGRRPPLPPVCGPSGPAVTMAVPGEWLRFRAGA